MMNEKIDPLSTAAYELTNVLRYMGEAVGQVNVANGWDTSRMMQADPHRFDPKWVETHKIAELGLIDTEVSEAIEEVRHRHAMTETYYSHPANKNITSPSRPVPEDPDRPWKPEGVPSELADVLIRVLDIADAYGIDLGAAFVEKLNHNATRGLHHGGKAL